MELLIENELKYNRLNLRTVENNTPDEVGNPINAIITHSVTL